MADYNKRSSWLRGVASRIDDRDIAKIINIYADRFSALAKLQDRSSNPAALESDNAYPICRR